MRYSVMVAGLVAGLLATPVLAETKVVVLDYQAAILATDHAKKATEKLQAELKVQRDRVNQLRTELEGLDAKAKKDAAVMSPQDKQKLQKEIEGKAQEYNNLMQTLQKRGQDMLNDLVARMGPKLEKVVVDMQQANKYDIILQKQTAVYFDPAADITKRVTEKLNAAMAAPAK